jgi:hypothetical protein
MSLFACRTLPLLGAVWIALNLSPSLHAQDVAPPVESADVPAPPVGVTPATAAPVPVVAAPATTPALANGPIQAAPALPVVALVAAATPALASPYVAQGSSPTGAGEIVSRAMGTDVVVPAVAASMPAPAAPLAQATTPPPPPPAPPPGATAAQEGAPPPPPAAPPEGGPRPSTRPQQPPRPAIVAAAPGVGPYVAKDVNIRVEATITESRGEQTLGRKVISVTLRDGDTGSVRSSALVPQPKFGGSPDEQGLTRAPLNMDATVFLREGGRVLARVTLEYNRGSVEIGNSGAQRAAFDSGIRQSVSVMLENGKPLVVAQSADPEGDRRVTLELKATILK